MCLIQHAAVEARSYKCPVRVKDRYIRAKSGFRRHQTRTCIGSRRVVVRARTGRPGDQDGTAVRRFVRRRVINAEPCPRVLGREIPVSRRRMVLVACVLASSMAFIDGAVLTVALPSLRVALAADLATVQWVMNAYLLALAALTLIGGALADAYGKARMLAIGCLMFGAVSVACALAPSIGWLIGARSPVAPHRG